MTLKSLPCVHWSEVWDTHTQKNPLIIVLPWSDIDKCPRHVRSTSCTCTSLHAHANVCTCSGCQNVYNSVIVKFMCNLFKCVHKACGCRLRQSSQLVRNQLFSPSRSCPLPHSPLNSVTICPLAIFTSFLSLCHTKTWIPRLHLMQCFQVAKEPKEAVVADGFSRLGPIVTERNKNEKHQKVRCNLQSPSACVL